LRVGMPIGLKVTLRGERMWHFLEKLVTVALPRIRDFQGVPDKSFDGRGNYSLGLKEQLVFPEIEYDKIDRLRGMEITICTTARREQPAETAERTERPARKPAPPKKARPKGIGMPNDPVADLLTRVRNAAGARHETVSVPTSRMKAEVARILRDEGFISGYEQPNARELVLRMKYVGKLPAVSGLRRISKPGLRVYARKTEMPRVLGGLGVAIISTSSGLMTGREAERKGLGGEVLAYVW